MDRHFRRSVNNVIAHGDTDIFPYSFENTLLNHYSDDVIELLIEIDKNFDDQMVRNTPQHEMMLVPVGYTGFRWGTQMDPLWNLYFLSLVISLGEDIEKARIRKQNETIFSYRFVKKSTDHYLFDKTINWHSFMIKSIEHANTFDYVLICDISDFYNRVGHHSLENALKQCAKGASQIPKIMGFLSNYNDTKSYSIPVGGPASRLLSELVLNKTDRLLASEKITFCRFADDYHIFANSKNELYNILVYLSQKLILNEGLTLQKAKTRIMTTSEFNATHPLKGLVDPEPGEKSSSDKVESDKTVASLMRLSLRFDPYSATAEEDYDELKKKVQQYDIIGLLHTEIQKTNIHIAVVRKLVQTIKLLDDKRKNDATYTLINNHELLFPVFTVVLLTIYNIYDDLEEKTKGYIQNKIRELIQDGNHVFSLDIHVSYAVRLIGKHQSPENEQIIVDLYSASASNAVRSDIILILAKWEQSFFLSDLLRSFRKMSGAERRALIVASYRLTDEGSHWRDHAMREFSPMEELCRKWASSRVSQHKWEVPI